MLIRSKNKMHIVNIRSGVVSAEGNGTIEFRKGKIRIVLGEYSSLKKALKVLDMIQEAYVKSEVEKYITPASIKRLGESPLTSTFEEIFKTRMVFQMPEDSEVEV